MKLMNNDDWDFPNRIEINYYNSLKKLIKSFINSISISPENNSPFHILSKFVQFFNSEAGVEYINATATRMITGLRVNSAKTWREAASEGMRSKDIRELLMKELKGTIGIRINELVEENQQFISTFSDDIKNKAEEYIKEEMLKGRRSESIAKDLIEQFPDITEGRLKLIARTETSKASTALIRARSEYLNLPWYIWVTSTDIRVRKSHKHMQGVLINWNDPPSPERLSKEKDYGEYHAGNIFNCRCYPRPLLSLEDTTWPHKVYHNGAIVTMTRTRFEKISGLKEANAA